MNDFDSIIGGAVGARADSAPASRPEFGDLLVDRQQKLRRRSVIGAIGVLAIGATAMAAFAVGGPTESTADGPDSPIGSDGPFATTTVLGAPVAGSVQSEMVWYCEGRLDKYSNTPTTTTIAPPTTVVVPVDSGSFPDATFMPATEDSGYFRNCVFLEVGPAAADAPVDDGVTVTTFTEQFPTTTSNVPGADVAHDTVPVATDVSIATGVVNDSQFYVVQAGDYALKVADQFCVPLEDLINFNGWNSGNEFPFPGEVIAIPPGGCIESPSTPCTTPGCDVIHTIQDGDYLIKIANDYCVDMADILAVNGWKTGNELPFPGERMLIPAPVENGACPDNGDSD